MNKGSFNDISKIDCRLTTIEKELDVLLSEKDELLKKRKMLENTNKKDISFGNTDYSKSNFSWSSTLQNICRDKFNVKELKALQIKTINATLSKRDCILITQPGGGKSLCYQLASMFSGITLTFTPLISLMHDQMLSSKKFNIPCIALDSNCPVKLQNEIFKAMENDPVDDVTFKIIYVSPEKLTTSKKFMKAVEKAYNDNRISHIVIDEIHCCSPSGHDFKQDYKSLATFKSSYPNIPILGLTSTASDAAVCDIKDSLGLDSNCLVFRDNYKRPNLFYDTQLLTNDVNERQEICNLIKTKYNGQSGIVYCFTQKDCELLSTELEKSGTSASCYHANLSYDSKKDTHDKWLNNQFKVIVATNAFGMGIDKPDVRFVIHMSMSKSLENYYQESGRAGRDGKRADCILFWKLSEYFKISSNLFTEKVGINNLNVMNQFCVNDNQCKRYLLSKVFNEKYSKDDCKKMCSVCENTDSQSADVDIKEILNCALKIIGIVEKSKNPKITGNKMIGELVNQLEGFRNQLSTKFPGLDNKLFIDRAFCHLIEEGYLKLDFHFGSFSNFTYVLAGPNSTKAVDKISLKTTFSKDSSKNALKRELADSKSKIPNKLMKK